MRRREYHLDVVSQRRLLQRLHAALPLNDLMGWLIGEFPLAAREEIFAMVKAVYEVGLLITPASAQPRSYDIGGQVVKACPQRVEIA